ncbi:MAG: cadmium-translocating P-type ATPase [Rhodobacteraceae bacterium]|nr:cadmium-translocating P-type ATPase [Paracoccaceae bacterium]
MTAAVRPSLATCPACGVGAPVEAKPVAPQKDDILLSLPGIHCAGCISEVERTLKRQPGVRAARVNLTQKRATVQAEDGVNAEDLTAALEQAGYEAHELDAASLGGQDDPRGRALLMRLGVAGFAMMNVMLLSVAVWSGASDATRDMFHWISGAIALPTIVFSAQPFFASAWSALRAWRLNMDVPISLAIVLAAAISVYETSVSGAHAYFDAALSLTFFLLAGRYLDYRTRSLARSAASELAALEVPRATRTDGQVVPISDLRPGDLVRVVPGARMPVDGIIIRGESEIDRSFLTGESLPVFAGPDTEVSAGEVNLTGVLTVRVTAAGRDSSLHRLADLVALAEDARNRYTSLADRAARIYAPVVHLLSFAAFVGWMMVTGDARLSLNIAVATLIITCPCALGLAVPAVSTAASGRLFRKGLLIKSPTALERLSEVDTVVFDKTGTLTEGLPVADPISGVSSETLSLALALAEASAHPLAQSLSQAIREDGVSPADLTALREVPGQGVEGNWNGKTVRLGRAAWVGAEAAAGTAAYLGVDGKQPQTFTFTGRLRPGAAETVAKLRAKGKRVILLSGDSAAATSDIAAQLGIGDWRAEVLPQDKAEVISSLARDGHKVLMVGDGLNDTAALASAHASISPGSALEAARMVSDIVLLGRSLEPVVEAIDTSRSAVRRIVENFAIAALYNAVAIPVAVLGFATPLAAALAMSGSSIMVSLNALRLR